MTRNPNEITETEVSQITNSIFDENFWLFQLGAAVNNVPAQDEKYFSYDFHRIGAEYWNKIKPNLKAVLCDDRSGQPIEGIKKAIDSDAKDLVVAVLSTVMSQLSVALTIAIPIASILLKRGLNNLCSELK